jgi:hypothetical protein
MKYYIPKTIPTMKKNKIKIYLLIFVITVITTFTQCEHGCDTYKNYKFTDDELEWAKWEKDTLQYLVNDTDTISVIKYYNLSGSSVNECETYEEAHTGFDLAGTLDFINVLSVFIDKNKNIFNIYIYIS